MGEIVAYVVLILVIVVVEIQYRLERKRVKRFESLRLRVYDSAQSLVVFDRSLKMLEGLSGLDVPFLAFRGLVVKVYRKEGGD